ncbi:steroid reductase [Aspergillus campestris IBT 28561]|uniref:Steroid reductase n=1 Tax=Aspergillus campestris (strain IBT 28561) TaxID=1392248 RepID=A0A2I1CZW8_ASPC2|nr:steroid reductase [Aspergillus campestris IBT 28561]PKY03141.1 steroid reductase [Aspergillus campestris IBT 28561]
MSLTTIDLAVVSRGKPIKDLPKRLQIASNGSTNELYRSVAATLSLSINRLRITHGRDRIAVPNSTETTIAEIGLEDQDMIHVKDLGPQISWRTVYIAEYLGPALIPVLFLFPLRPYLYNANLDTIPAPTKRQQLLCALLTIHFVKREYESMFIHRFSNATMPARNIVKNSSYYWIMVSSMAYHAFRPGPAAVTTLSETAMLCIGVALFIFGELANLNAHFVLRNLRRPGSSERGIPRGLGFGMVTCPHYLFEVVSWVGIYLVGGMRSWSILAFIVVGSVQMALWSKKRERRYRLEFGGRYKPKRFVMIPGVV